MRRPIPFRTPFLVALLATLALACAAAEGDGGGDDGHSAGLEPTSPEQGYVGPEAVVPPSGSVTGAAAPVRAEDFERVEDPRLAAVLRAGPRIYSGAVPVGPEAFQALAELGVTTVVCVDGARPDVDAAAAVGLRYFHVPIGYDGVDEGARAAIVRILEETEGPIFFHCHHGHHRGPAAAAVALRALGADADTARAFLVAAGTSPDYPGLWRDVASFTPPSPGEVAAVRLSAVAEVEDFAAGMAQLDRIWDGVRILADAGWTTPLDHPDLDPDHQPVLVRQALEACAEATPERWSSEEEFRRQMRRAVERAFALESAAAAGDAAGADAAFRALKRTCMSCHDTYRDGEDLP